MPVCKSYLPCCRQLAALCCFAKLQHEEAHDGIGNSRSLLLLNNTRFFNWDFLESYTLVQSSTSTKGLLEPIPTEGALEKSQVHHRADKVYFCFSFSVHQRTLLSSHPHFYYVMRYLVTYAGFVTTRWSRSSWSEGSSSSHLGSVWWADWSWQGDTLPSYIHCINSVQ